MSNMSALFPQLGDPLSPREIQVAASLIEGKADKTIAAEMGIAPRTVKFYVKNLMIKLGAINRTVVAVKFARGLDARQR